MSYSLFLGQRYYFFPKSVSKIKKICPKLAPKPKIGIENQGNLPKIGIETKIGIGKQLSTQ